MSSVNNSYFICPGHLCKETRHDKTKSSAAHQNIKMNLQDES